MKTKARLTLLLGVMLLLITVLSVVSLATIWKLRSEGTNVIKANYNSIAYMQAMLELLDTETDTIRRTQGLRAQLALQQATITEPSEAEATASLAEAVRAAVHAPADLAAISALRKAIARVIDLNRNAIVLKAEAQEERGERAVLWISLAATFGFLIAFSLFLGVPEQLTEPIRKLTEGIDRIAAGHYSERVELRRRDEFGQMAARFNAMAAELERWQNSNLAHIMTEKARAEAVINSLRDPSIGVDESGRVLFMNRQAADLLGVEPGEMLGLDRVEAARRNDLIAHILDSRTAKTFKAVLQGREQHFTVESSEINTGRTLVGTVFTLHNITPYLERDQAKTMFLATISHELKTPLASIDIGLTLLERQHAERLTSDQAAIIGDLRRDHQRLVRIVSELLNMAQVETGNIRVNVVPCVLTGLVEEAIQAIGVTARQKEVTIVQPTGRDALQVMADPDKTVWVLVNVLVNAVRHSPVRGRITLEVAQNEQRITLAVSDQGPGVAIAERDRLFQRFAPGAGIDQGSGLGLAIAREIMLAMDGDLAHRPSAQGGATFVLTFTKG